MFTRKKYNLKNCISSNHDFICLGKPSKLVTPQHFKLLFSSAHVTYLIKVLVSHVGSLDLLKRCQWSFFGLLNHHFLPHSSFIIAIKIEVFLSTFLIFLHFFTLFYFCCCPSSLRAGYAVIFCYEKKTNKWYLFNSLALISLLVAMSFAQKRRKIEANLDKWQINLSNSKVIVKISGVLVEQGKN